MTESDRIAIEHACARLVTAYCLLVDARSHEALTKLWAADGTWASMIGPLKGHADIRRYLDGKAMSLTRHISTNIQVEVVDADHARGTSYFTLYRSVEPAKDGPTPMQGPMMVGQYFDDYVRSKEGWRFAHRRMEVAFKAPG